MHIILERIFLILVGGIFIAIWKMFKSIGGAIEQSAERKQGERDSQKAFGKFNHEIEIYDPSPSPDPAHQADQNTPPQKPKSRP